MLAVCPALDAYAQAAVTRTLPAGWVSGMTLLVAGGSMATSDVFRITRKHNPVPESMKI